MSRKYIAGLDLGTTKVSVVVARMIGRSAEVVGFGAAPSRGMRKGVVVDIEAVTDSIRRAVADAVQRTGIEINSVYVGVAGEHIECLDSYGAMGIKGHEVTDEDVEAVLNSASTIYVPLDREILHVLPVNYRIDGQDNILKPLGMSGVRLEAKVKVVTASQHSVDNVVKCCQRAGLSVLDVVFEAVASSMAVLKGYEKDTGVALIDIGGGTTDVAVYKEGGLAHAAVLPVGGNHLTNDLAIGLKVSSMEAERVKVMHGYAVSRALDSVEVDVTVMDGTSVKIRRDALRNIILPRCEEIFEIIAEEVQGALEGSSAACAVITGGSALLEGMDRVAEAKLGVPVRLGLPDNGSGPTADGLFDNPIHATGVGLYLYGAEREARNGAGLMESIAEGFAGLWKNLFEKNVLDMAFGRGGAQKTGT